MNNEVSPGKVTYFAGALLSGQGILAFIAAVIAIVAFSRSTECVVLGVPWTPSLGRAYAICIGTLGIVYCMLGVSIQRRSRVSAYAAIAITVALVAALAAYSAAHRVFPTGHFIGLGLLLTTACVAAGSLRS